MRGVVPALAAVLLAAACASPARGPGRAGGGVAPATFVFVHGAWGGGWAWRGVERRLRDLGYDVLRPTLTGLGERRHLASPEIGLSTHVQDVVNVLVFEEARDVVLVGHSYGGMVATAAADRMPERIRKLVYLDALVPEDGESVLDLMPDLVAGVLDGARERGRGREGWLVPYWADPGAPPPGDVPQPLRTMTEPVSLSGPPGAGRPVSYVLTRMPGEESDAFDWAASRARGYGWDVRVMEAGHVPYRTHPDALVALLVELAGPP